MVLAAAQIEKTRSFFNFFSKYCTAAEDLVVHTDIEHSCADFLDRIFQIRTLRRVSLDISPYGLTSLCLSKPALCKDLEILNIKGGGIIAGFEAIWLVSPDFGPKSEHNVELNITITSRSSRTSKNSTLIIFATWRSLLPRSKNCSASRSEKVL